MDLPACQYAKTGDLETAYRLDGPVDAPVLMLGHSLAADLRMWEPNLPLLQQHYRVLRYDLRGHGRSTVPLGPYSIEQLADDAVALLDYIGIGQVHYLGLSLGGMVGQWLGAKHSHRLHSLLLSNTLSRQPAPEIWNDRIALARNQGLSALVDATLQRWLTDAFRVQEPETVTSLRRMILATPLEGYAGAASAVRDVDQEHILGDIHVPTLVVTGAGDATATPDVARGMQNKIPGSSLALIENAAHLPNVEWPEVFGAVVLRFTSTIDSRPK